MYKCTDIVFYFYYQTPKVCVEKRDLENKTALINKNAFILKLAYFFSFAIKKIYISMIFLYLQKATI